MATKTWTGGNNTNLWGDNANWSPSGAPSNGDAIVLPATITHAMDGAGSGPTGNIQPISFDTSAYLGGFDMTTSANWANNFQPPANFVANIGNVGSSSPHVFKAKNYVNTTSPAYLNATFTNAINQCKILMGVNAAIFKNGSKNGTSGYVYNKNGTAQPYHTSEFHDTSENDGNVDNAIFYDNSTQGATGVVNHDALVYSTAAPNGTYDYIFTDQVLDFTVNSPVVQGGLALMSTGASGSFKDINGNVFNLFIADNLGPDEFPNGYGYPLPDPANVRLGVAFDAGNQVGTGTATSMGPFPVNANSIGPLPVLPASIGPYPVS